MTNCSEVLPYASTYFDEISTGELVNIVIGGFLSIFTLGLFFYNVKIELRWAKVGKSAATVNKVGDCTSNVQANTDPEHQTKQNVDQEGIVNMDGNINMESYVERQAISNSKLQKLIAFRNIQIFAIYPVISISSILAVCVPRTTHLSELIISTYIAVCIYNMASLMINHFSDKAKMYQNNNTIPLRAPPLCFILCCLPRVAVNKQNVKRIQFLILQSIILNPLLSLIILVLWLDGHYTNGKSGADEPNIYLTFPTTISSMFALYGLILISRVCREYLSKKHLTRFYLFQAVLVLYYIQALIAAILENFDVPSCRGTLSSAVRGQGIFNMVLVWEMFILASVTVSISRFGQCK